MSSAEQKKMEAAVAHAVARGNRRCEADASLNTVASTKPVPPWNCLKTAAARPWRRFAPARRGAGVEQNVVELRTEGEEGARRPHRRCGSCERRSHMLLRLRQVRTRSDDADAPWT